MSIEPQTFRVSRRFLASLWYQALFASLGIFVSSILFWALSCLLLPPFDIALDQQGNLANWAPLLQTEFWTNPSPQRDREALRFGIGIFLTVAVWMGGLGDYVAWSPIRYEIQQDKLIMRWRFWSRTIAWDVIQSVDERPHENNDLHSLLVHSTGERPILVRGLAQMPEFIEIIKANLSSLARWSCAKISFDMTSFRVNFVIGAMIPLPFHVTWLLAYVAGWSEISIITFWSIVLVPVAFGLWYGRPLSLCHSCAREIEQAIAILILILSGLFSLILWMDSPLGTWTIGLFL